MVWLTCLGNQDGRARLPYLCSCGTDVVVIGVVNPTLLPDTCSVSQSSSIITFRLVVLLMTCLLHSFFKLTDSLLTTESIDKTEASCCSSPIFKKPDETVFKRLR